LYAGRRLFFTISMDSRMAALEQKPKKVTDPVDFPNPRAHSAAKSAS
jgi:hypothetical protein